MLVKQYNLIGGFNPLKNISQMGLLFPIYGTIKHVPNHQPVIVIHPQISTINGLYKIVQAINMGGL
jgi:hypothetical protein